MLRFFPFGETYNARMGGRPLQAGEPVCDVDLDTYVSEVALKRQLLDQHPAYYFCGGTETLVVQWEALRLILEDLAACYPQYFQLHQEGMDWRWHNRLLGERHSFRYGERDSLPCEPLDWAGRQVQEDLLLLEAEAGQRFVGGQLCFANGWSIGTHLGKTFLGLHGPLPETNMPAIHAGQRLLEHLKPGKTIWRMNWSFKLTDRMDLSTRHTNWYQAELAARLPLLTPSTAGDEIILRVERQTLTRLPGAPLVLFGIHTYNRRVAQEAADPQRASSMLKVIRDLPEDVRAYKALSGMEPVLLEYLESKCR